MYVNAILESADYNIVTFNFYLYLQLTPQISSKSKFNWRVATVFSLISKYRTSLILFPKKKKRFSLGLSSHKAVRTLTYWRALIE